ncbi:MAG: hypothetical protein WC683_13685 [bacterium]
MDIQVICDHADRCSAGDCRHHKAHVFSDGRMCGVLGPCRSMQDPVRCIPTRDLGLFDPAEQKRMTERRRYQVKRGRRMIYDCWHAKVKGGFVRCDWNRLAEPVPLAEALSGACLQICQDCKDYDYDG